MTLTKNRNVVEYEDVLGSCLEECSRMSRLVDSLLFLARADQPESCLKLEKLRLRDELAMIQDFYEVAAEDGKVTLTATSPDLEIVADRTFFQRVIGNLITNAISHTPEGGTIDLHAEAIPNEIRVVVKDSGNGISANELPLVFDRLYSGSRTHNGSRGHGLGLSIVKTIVELHGGSVCITSSEGSGTTVETIWPIDMALKCHSQD